MLWSIILIPKNNNGWYINYIENKLINQINALKLEKDIEVVVFDKKLEFFGEYVSIVDNVEISNNFIELIYNKLKNCKKDCIGLKTISYMDNIPLQVDLPISKLNPIRTDIILKIENFNYYINSENLSTLVKTIDNLNTPVIYIEDLKKQPFSIIISAYKSQKYIEECLDSIENQTYFKDNDNYEVLIGVDGCQDTLDKLQEIKHKYRNLHIYMMSENKGTYITCNTLIDLVKYENVIRFDSDDVMTLNMINEVARNINDNDIMILGSLDLTNGIVGTKFLLTEGSIYFRKSMMDNIAGGYQPWICSADTELIKRTVNNVKITQLKKALFHRRLHSESLTQKEGTRYKSELREGYKKLIKPYYKDNEIKIERVVNSIKSEIENIENIENINLNDYFDHIYCLNLDRRIDKWIIMKNKFDKLNIKAYRFSAIDGETLSDDIVKKYNNLSKGAIGCILSYYEIIKDAKNNKYKNILIFEDDVLFDKNFNKKFSIKIKNIKNWKMLHLGASQYNWNNIEYIDNFYYSKETQGTFSIAFDESIYDDILRTDNIINLPIDAKLFEIQKKYYKECYTFFPNLTIADVSTSDIRSSRNINSHSIKMKWNLDLYDDNKLKVLLLPDVSGWAFDNIAKSIIKYNPYPDKISYTIKYIRQNPTVNYDDWDYVYIFFEGYTNIPINKNKTVRGCYSSFWLENNLYTPEYIGNSFSKCKGVIFVNDNIANNIIPYLKNVDHTIIYDSSDDEIFYPIKNNKSNDFNVIFVGNTERKIKNFKDIVDICKITNVNLIVAKNIEHDKLVYEYNKADLCINFSDEEGGPQTFIESALCEIPMLIRDNISLAKYIPCFKGKTKNDFIEIINYLKNNKNECVKIGKLARNVVLNNFTYKIAAEKYTNFFLNLDKNNIYNMNNKKFYNNELTVFIVRSGENPNYNDCINALNNQTINFNIKEIKDIAPMSKAFQNMIDLCETKYYIQVDEDMILMPNAIEILYNSIKNSSDNISTIAYMLHDYHLDFNIFGIKAYKHNIFINYPYNLDIISCEVEQLSRLEKDGYSTLMFYDVLGEHSPKWTDNMIFERYFDLMEKWKIYKYDWMNELPKKLIEIFRNDPNDKNLYALLGAITSLSTDEPIRKREKNYLIEDENFKRLQKIISINDYKFIVNKTKKSPEILDRCYKKDK